MSPESAHTVPTWVHHTYSDPTWRIPWDYPVDSFHIMLGIVSRRFDLTHEPTSVLAQSRPAIRRAPVKPSKRGKRGRK